MSETKRWQKVEAPRNWRPNPGDEVVGIYAGSQIKDGEHGPYFCAFIRPDNGRDVVTATGARLQALFVSVMPGARIRLVFNGRETFVAKEGEVREMKEYELYLEVTEITLTTELAGDPRL